MKRAVVIGATGLVGHTLLMQLLADERYSKVLVLGRRSVDYKHDKLEERLGDLLSDEYWKFTWAVDEVFCCVGTTRSKTSDMGVYKQIDYGIPVHSAQWAIKNGVGRYLVISSIGADKKSRIFYSRVKGQMEEALRKMAFPRLYILRPSIILGHREERRIGESIGKFLTRTFSFLLPSRYKGIHARSIAAAMIALANSTSNEVVYESDELRKLSAGRE